MNAIITLDSILEPSQALAPASLFGTGQITAIISAIESQVRAEAYDITTAEGRERIKSVAYKVARSKTTLDEIGKEYVAEIKKQSAAIDAERRTIRDRLDSLKDEVRGPLTRWEEDEANRINEHERLLVEIIESVRFASTVPSANLIEQRISAVNDLYNRDWQEFQARAEGAAFEANATLETMLTAAEQAEAERAELEALRQEKAERDARDAADRQRLAAEQAEQERNARREQEERDRLAQLETWKAEQEARAARQAEEAAARAVEQERQRAAAEEARKAAEKAAQEAAEQKRQENQRHRTKVHKKIVAGLILNGLVSDAADEIALMIIDGKIPHVSVTY